MTESTQITEKAENNFKVFLMFPALCIIGITGKRPNENKRPTVEPITTSVILEKPNRPYKISVGCFSEVSYQLMAQKRQWFL